MTNDNTPGPEFVTMALGSSDPALFDLGLHVAVQLLDVPAKQMDDAVFFQTLKPLFRALSLATDDPAAAHLAKVAEARFNAFTQQRPDVLWRAFADAQAPKLFGLDDRKLRKRRRALFYLAKPFYDHQKSELPSLPQAMTADDQLNQRVCLNMLASYVQGHNGYSHSASNQMMGTVAEESAMLGMTLDALNMAIKNGYDVRLTGADCQGLLKNCSRLHDQGLWNKAGLFLKNYLRAYPQGFAKVRDIIDQKVGSIDSDASYNNKKKHQWALPYMRLVKTIASVVPAETLTFKHLTLCPLLPADDEQAATFAVLHFGENSDDVFVVAGKQSGTAAEMAAHVVHKCTTQDVINLPSRLKYFEELAACLCRYGGADIAATLQPVMQHKAA